MPNYYSTSDELKALRQENAELKARLKKIEFQTMDFGKMTHSQLMKFFVENFAEYSYNERGMENAGLTDLYAKWNCAIEPFKQKRKIRQNLISEYLKGYFYSKKGCSILVQEQVVAEIMPKIKEIYFNITPFDCEDEKWTGKWCEQSWVNRIHSFFSDEARKNGFCFTEKLVCLTRK